MADLDGDDGADQFAGVAPNDGMAGPRRAPAATSVDGRAVVAMLLDTQP